MEIFREMCISESKEERERRQRGYFYDIGIDGSKSRYIKQ